MKAINNNNVLDEVETDPICSLGHAITSSRLLLSLLKSEEVTKVIMKSVFALLPGKVMSLLTWQDTPRIIRTSSIQHLKKRQVLIR
jgi:hypothetical protein